MLQTRVRTSSALINVMASAVLKAGKGLIRDFNEVDNLQVSRKGPGNFVSAADHRSEKIIRQELEKARPNFGFLMEESGEIPGIDTRHRWIVDPLDGTTNFLHAIPHFCISIALEFENAILAGVTYDPLKDELFYAEKGKGAFLNERRIRVSSRKLISDALVATTRSTRIDKENQTSSTGSKMKKLAAQGVSLRHFGASALDLCYVAAGRLDGFFAYDQALWDIAAGVLMVHEAGGQVKELTKEGPLLKTGHLLATNGYFQEELQASLKD